MAASKPLDAYRRKRDFSRSPEPEGSDSGGSAPRFVIQKHDARSLHYDFRLEADGVLVSWAVPKGPSPDPAQRRLAIHVEDHPVDYADFEGIIPEGEYGGGTVIVWDRGPYRNLMGEKDEPLTVRESVEAGHVEVWLEGEKLRGGYVLVRIDEEKDQWLLIKMKDTEADEQRDPLATSPESVVTGRTIDEVREEAGAG